jgi:hypothetical protein
MKQITLVISGLLCLQAVHAQKTKNKDVVQPVATERPADIHYPNGVTYSQCTSFGETRPFRELAAEQGLAKPTDAFDMKEADRKEMRKLKVTANPAGTLTGEDPSVQSTPGYRVLTPTGLNFQGQSGSGSPLDPNGAVGLSDYVQVVNSYYRAYNKTTGAALINSLNLTAIFGSNAFCDPVCLYDKYADRWFIGMLSSVSTSAMIAVSKTNDPTGAFYTWTFDYKTTNSGGIDYPKWSIWQDGYYLGMNLSNEEISVFNRTQMLAGNAAAGKITLTSPVVPTAGFFCPMPADADGVLPPTGTPCYIFAFEDNNWSGASADQIHIFKMTTNWTTPASSSLVEDAADGSPLAVNAFNSYWSNYGTEITQKGSSQGLDAIQGIFMFRAQFRKWTGYNTVVLNNAVNMGSGQSGIRWYELRQNQSTSKWTVYQQGTYSPDATENRWVGSIAMDANGSIGMAYCVSGPGEYPSIRYTGRYSSDPLGTFTFAEQVAKAGAGSKAGPNDNRWGDYSSTNMDPSDDMTFWHTSMWGGTGGAENTQIFNFKITQSVATGIDEKTLTPSFTAYLNGSSTLLVKGTTMSSNDEISVDLFDVEGKLIENKMITPSGNSFETSFGVNSLAKGTYLIRIGNLNFQKVIKVAVN